MRSRACTVLLYASAFDSVYSNIQQCRALAIQLAILHRNEHNVFSKYRSIWSFESQAELDSLCIIHSLEEVGDIFHPFTE
jgi:hypothetical protein